MAVASFANAFVYPEHGGHSRTGVITVYAALWGWSAYRLSARDSGGLAIGMSIATLGVFLSSVIGMLFWLSPWSSNGGTFKCHHRRRSAADRPGGRLDRRPRGVAPTAPTPVSA